MQAIRFTIAIVILLGFGTRAVADSYAPSTPEAFLSPSGKHLVRIEAADSVENPRFYWKHTEFNLFSYNDTTETYDRVTKFDVEGHPLLLFINDAGTHIVTIDQNFGVGYGQIAAIYDIKGKRLADWNLENLFKANPFDFRRFPNFRRSTSSIYWRGDAGWSHDQKTIWISPPTKVESHDDGTFTVTHPVDIDSYEINLEKLQMSLVPSKKKKAEQASTGQPATRPESKSEGSDKPEPEAEGRSR
jgi:hypothetical protein